ncbi:ER lumen protein-retaining receptor 2 [Apodemus speciosus]|uniref:ER lumen protein-retaining receptor 2 n=1 Tax=Apodemus speciosus TaxID=105296 RepID=A0ABQ0ETT3_APOSI
MNIFRLTGDLSHLAAIVILLLKIWKTRSCAELIYIACSYATVYLIYMKFKATYDGNHDTFLV